MKVDGPVFLKDPADLERLRGTFNQFHSVRLPAFLEPGLLRFVQDRIDRAPFHSRTHERELALELCMEPNETYRFLKFLMNQPKLIRQVEAITGCGPVGSFAGRIYRLQSDQEHYFRWHSDTTDQRLIGVTVNLSREVYRGGLLQIKDQASQRLIREWANVGFGDAILFRISESLQHRVTRVEGTAPKVSLAGWFTSQPNFRSLFESAPSASGGCPGAFAPVTLWDRFEIPKEVASVADEEGVLLFDAQAGFCCRLDPVGARMWEFLSDSKPLRVAFEAMLEEFDVQPAHLEKDLLRLTGELQREGFLRASRE